MKITLEIERDSFFHEILGSAFTTWFWWHEETYDKGYEWNKYPDDPDQPFLTLGILDPDDEEEEQTIVKKLSLNDIARGFSKCGYSKWTGLDAGSSDWIMQCAFFDSDEAIYG
jgi:hypothetical protein